MKNLDLRREYMRTHPTCEYCGVLRKLVKGIEPCVCGAVECDHVVGGTGGRWDVVTNMIATCRPCHAWKTQHSREGQIAAFWHKYGRGEFDYAEFTAVSGKQFEGWLEYLIAGELLPGFTAMAVDLLQKSRAA